MRHVAALVLGAAVALAAVMVHRHGPVTLALAAVTSLATAARLRGGDRPSVASAFCLGWLLVLGLVVLGRPEGDWAIGSDPAGYTVSIVGLVLVVVGVACLPGRRAPGPT